MEEKINVEETLKTLKKEKVENFISGKLDGAEFLDTQKGMVSAWLEEAINLGYEIGEEHGMCKSNPEALGRIIDAFSSALGVGGSNEGEEYLRKIIYNQRGIVRNLVMAIRCYESTADELVAKSIPLRPKFFECLGSSK